MEKKNSLKKILATGAIITALAVSTIPTEALAYVSPSDILGDEQYVEMYNETRDAVKQNDAVALQEHFKGYDEYGCETTTLDDICKARALSDLLASYSDPSYEYTNCTPAEIMSLNINDLYNQYLYAQSNGTVYDFIVNNLTNKPAIDAYLNFAGLAVSARIKEDLANMVYSCIVNEGRNITKYPTIEIRNRQIYAVVEFDGNVELIELTGESTKDLEKICSYLDARTNMILKNVSGESVDYPQGLCYNGVSRVTDESAYLSLPDDQYKNIITSSAFRAEEAKYYENFEYYVEDPAIGYGLGSNEVELLSELGYTSNMINNARLRYAGIYPAQTYTK